VDFCVTKGIPQDFAVAKSYFDLSSDQSPVLITLTHALNQENQPSLSNRHKKLGWLQTHHQQERLTLNVSLKTEEDVEAAVKFYNNAIPCAGWNAMSEHRDIQGIKLPILIKQKWRNRRLRTDRH
jgi:hypothetical protein